MNIYTNTTFEGKYPVGTAAVVRAETKAKAAAILNAELRLLGIKGRVSPEDMQEFVQDVEILNDGDY